MLTAAQGKGYAREAVHCALQWALGPFDLMRIEADVDPRNTRSMQLVSALGFQREGLLRQRWRVGTDVQDTAFFGLLRGELIKPAR